MTIQAAAELKNYGVSVNAIAPAARTRMTVGAGGAMAEAMAAPEEGFDAMAPENISPLVVWLGSAESKDVTGRVFEVEGGKNHRRGGLASRPRARTREIAGTRRRSGPSWQRC